MENWTLFVFLKWKLIQSVKCNSFLPSTKKSHQAHSKTGICLYTFQLRGCIFFKIMQTLAFRNEGKKRVFCFYLLLYWSVLPVFHVPVHVGFEDVIGDRISFQGRKVKIVVFKIFICDKLLGIWLYVISVLKDTSEQQPDDI